MRGPSSTVRELKTGTAILVNSLPCDGTVVVQNTCPQSGRKTGLACLGFRVYETSIPDGPSFARTFRSILHPDP